MSSLVRPRPRDVEASVHSLSRAISAGIQSKAVPNLVNANLTGRVLQCHRGLVSIEVDFDGGVGIGDRVSFNESQYSRNIINDTSWLPSVGLVTGFNKNIIYASLITNESAPWEGQEAEFGTKMRLPRQLEMASQSRSSVTGNQLLGSIYSSVLSGLQQTGGSQPSASSTSTTESGEESEDPILEDEQMKKERLAAQAKRQEAALQKDFSLERILFQPEVSPECDVFLRSIQTRPNVTSSAVGNTFGRSASPRILTGNYLLDLCGVIRNGQRVALTGLPGTGKTYFLSTIARSFKQGQSIVVCEARNAKKFPNSICFSQDLENPHAPEQAWLTLLMAIIYARKCAMNNNDALLVLEDIVHFEQVANPQALFSVKQLLQQAYGAPEKSLTVFGAIDGLNHHLVEDSADRVLNFESKRPDVRSIRRHTEVHLSSSNQRLERNEEVVMRQTLMRRAEEAARRGVHDEMEEDEDSGVQKLLSVKANEDSKDVMKSRADAEDSTALDLIRSDCLRRINMGNMESDKMHLQDEFRIHVDFWDREETESLAATEIILNAFNSTKDCETSARVGNSETSGMKKRIPAASETSKPKFDTTVSSAEEKLASYSEKLGGKLGFLGGLASSRARKSSNIPKLEGASAGAGDRGMGVGMFGATSGRANPGSNNTSGGHTEESGTTLASTTWEEVAVLTRACTIYHFTKIPNADEAAAFRKQFARIFEQEFPAFLEDKTKGSDTDNVSNGSWLFEKGTQEQVRERLNHLDKALLQLRFEFDLTKPRIL